MATVRSIGTGALTVLASALVLAPAAAADLPTNRELERATGRFLAQHGGPDRLRAGSGGVGIRSERVLPATRVVGLYGAPQMGRTVLGSVDPKRAAATLASRSAPFTAAGDRPVVGAFDLVSVFATASGGPDGLYRTRQDDEVIQIYLDQARAVGARLILDIQPGRARIGDELRALRQWIVQPDVDVALDAEWNVGRRGVPGRSVGKLTARQLNGASKRLARIVGANALPPKLLLVHQFKRDSVRGERRIRRRAGVQTVLSFDGIGGPAAKAGGYESLSVPRLFDGFMVFERLDRPVMGPPAILGLEPPPDVVLYQ
jgi:hypothetical protein